MLQRSVIKPLSFKAKKHTEHDQREDAEVKLQHVCLLVPRQAIFGQDSEQFTANGLLCRCVSILTHLVGVKGWWQSPEDWWMSKDEYGCTAGTTQRTIRANPQRVTKKPHISSKTSIKCARDGALAGLGCPRFGGFKTPPQTPPENSTPDSRPLNLVFNRRIM